MKKKLALVTTLPFDNNDKRLEELKEFYRVTESSGVITLGIRVLEFAMEQDSPIYFQDENGDFYEIEIG